MRQLCALSFAALILMPLGAGDAHAQPTPPANLRIVGESPDDGFGWQVAPAGDVDGDGATNLIVGGPASDALTAFAGRVYLFQGPYARLYPAAGATRTLSTPAFGDNLGFSVALAGDVDGDGQPDVLMGARGNDAAGIQAGRAYLFRGPVTGTTVEDADAVISGTAFEEVGRRVASAGDLDGDGHDDILLGTEIGGPADEGRVYVFNGPVSGSLTIGDATAVIHGAVADDALGASLAAAGDLNGDGFGDIVVGAPRTIALGGTNGPGRVFVFHGPFKGDVPASSAAAILTGELANDNFGIAVAVGDVNADGVADVVVGADQLFRDDGTGKAYVFHGPLAGSIQAANADAILRGTAVDDLFGGSVATADVDGDGRSDVIVGALGSAVTSGRGYVFRGPLSGSIPAGAATFIARGSSGDELGRSVSAADVDGDGRPEVIFGATSLANHGSGYVAVYAYPFPQSTPIDPSAKRQKPSARAPRPETGR